MLNVKEWVFKKIGFDFICPSSLCRTFQKWMEKARELSEAMKWRRLRLFEAAESGRVSQRPSVFEK